MTCEHICMCVLVCVVTFRLQYGSAGVCVCVCGMWFVCVCVYVCVCVGLCQMNTVTSWKNESWMWWIFQRTTCRGSLTAPPETAVGSTPAEPYWSLNVTTHTNTHMHICSHVIYSCDQSWVFSVTWSSEIILICGFTAQKHFWWKQYLLKLIHLIFQDSQMNRKFKRSAFIWNRNILWLYTSALLPLYKILHTNKFNLLLIFYFSGFFDEKRKAFIWNRNLL